jgi:hypothetical protein
MGNRKVKVMFSNGVEGVKVIFSNGTEGVKVRFLIWNRKSKMRLLLFFQLNAESIGQQYVAVIKIGYLLCYRFETEGIL